jgi:uncharacterized protein
MNLVLVLTDRCNRSCRYCYADRQRAASMSFRTARRGIEYAREKSRTPLRIGFFGGEPLMSFPRLREIVEYAEGVCDPAPRFSLTTNGDLLTDEVASFFGGIDVDVSLSVHDDRVEGTLGAAEKLIEEGIEPCAVLVATPESCATIAPRMQALVDGGVRRLVVSPDFYAPWDGSARERLQQTYRDLGDLYAREWREERPLRLNQFDMRFDAIATGIPLRKSHCELGDERLTVAPDGTLFPCDRMAVDSKCAFARIGHLDGDVEERKWSRIGEERSRIPTDCTTCEHRDTCLGACACVNLHLTGQVNAVPELVCWHETLVSRLVQELRPALPAHLPAPRTRRRIIRISTGLLVAGALAAGCARSEHYTGTIRFNVSESEVQPDDSRGRGSAVRLTVDLRMSPASARWLLDDREDEIERCVRRHIAAKDFGRLDQPEDEAEMGQELAAEIGKILGVGEQFEGLEFKISIFDDISIFDGSQLYEYELPQVLQGIVGY